MRKVIALEHISLDGYLAGPSGELDWVKLDDEIWDVVSELQARADAAIYGRVTFQMMEAYWPSAAEQPNATQHDIDHSRWVNAATKIVFSGSMKETAWANTRFVSGEPAAEIERLKQEPGKDMLLIGSARLVSNFLSLGLVDEMWLNLNPVLLGSGMPLFKDIEQRHALSLLSARPFPSGGVGLHYARA